MAKGVSAQEKRDRILNIYHETKEVYNLKEIEKLASKAGVVQQTVKDVNQALVDDGLVDYDKIGSANYFWSFPSKATMQRKRKLSQLEKRKETAQVKLAKTEESIAAERAKVANLEERQAKMKQLEEDEARVQQLEAQVQLLADNDPAVIEEMEQKVKIAKEGAERWTDNVFNLRTWATQKRGLAAADVDKWLGIKDDFDYVE